MSKQNEYWNRNERDLWVLSGPSRTLRKLYKQLADIDTDIERARKVNYCPEHAPTACRIAREVLNELEDKRYDILRRINNKQNQED